jgi:hypothetical protein
LVERKRFVDADWAAILLAAPEEPLREPEARVLRVRLPTAGATHTPLPQHEPAPPPAELPGQLTTELPQGGVALSSSRTLPTGARVAVLLAPNLFRIDVRHLEDTLKISLRNLSGNPIQALPDDGPPRTIVTSEDVTVKRPLATNARMRLRIGSGARAREAEIVLAALSGGELEAARIAAQAVIRSG